MNERVIDLYEQACDIERENELATKPYKDRVVIKFAELVIRECISTIENAENGYQDYRDQIEDGMRNHCISLIKNKFGVEE